MAQHHPASLGTSPSADPRAHRGSRARARRLLNSWASAGHWKMPDGARGAARERFVQPNGLIHAKRRGADAVPLDAKPTRASRPHRLVIPCSRIIRTRASPKDGAARVATTDVTGTQRVRAGTTTDRLFDVGITWTPLRFKGLGCSTPPCRRDPTTHHGGRRCCIGAGHGGSVVGGGLGGGCMETLRLVLYLYTLEMLSLRGEALRQLGSTCVRGYLRQVQSASQKRRTLDDDHCTKPSARTLLCPANNCCKDFILEDPATLPFCHLPASKI